MEQEPKWTAFSNLRRVKLLQKRFPLQRVFSNGSIFDGVAGQLARSPQ
jgi:hypothetical protein